LINTQLPASVAPAGWDHWGNSANEKTAYYAESNSTGAGALPASRAAWSHQLSAEQAHQYLPDVFLRGTDRWRPESEAAKLP
jgi:pectinesterase